MEKKSSEHMQFLTDRSKDAPTEATGAEVVIWLVSVLWVLEEHQTIWVGMMQSYVLCYWQSG